MEEHFVDEPVPTYTDVLVPAPAKDSLANVTQRLVDMAANGISRMLISWTGPTMQQLLPKYYHNASHVTRAINDALLEKVEQGGGRFKGLCSVWMNDVPAAIAELEYCKLNGMVGVLINGAELTVRDGLRKYDYYYGAETLPFWKACAALGMFAYIHPEALQTGPAGLYENSTLTLNGSSASVSAFDDNDSMNCNDRFELGDSWGFALSVAQVVSNLILHGLFDQVPDLQMVVGHNGEFLAYWLFRIDNRLSNAQEAKCTSIDDSGADPDAVYPRQRRQHSFQWYWQNHFYVTTSGQFDTAGLVHLLNTTTPDRVLFAIDSPFEDIVTAISWFRSVHRDHPEISCDTLKAVAYKNAEKLLNWAA